MRLFAKLFLRGLAAILPLALTGYLVYWAVVASGTMLTDLFRLFDVEVPRWLAFLVAIGLILLVGMLMYTFVARSIYAALERALQRIPVIKSIYGMMVDIVRLLGNAEQKPFRRVVMVRMPGSEAELIGFVTRDSFDDLPADFVDGDRVAVYLPMSYQLGGFTVTVPRANVREVSMSVEAALRWSVTAGVSRPDKD